MSPSLLVRILLPLLLLGALFLACESSTPPAGDPPEPTAAEIQPVAAAAAAEAEGNEGHDHGEAGHDCAAGARTVRLEHDRVEVRTAADGTSYTHIGAELEGAEEVAVVDLLADPDKWVGKLITVTGNVSTMCAHRRAWFGLVNEGDQSGSNLQVRTAPSFLVPAGSVGRTVKVEGRVEVVEISAGAARYLAEGHKMGEPEDIGEGPQKRVVVAATGADFL